MKKNDIYLIIIILLVSTSFLLFNKYKSTFFDNVDKIVEIQVKGEIYKTIPLTNKEELITIETGLGKNVIKINENGAHMIEADCADPEGWHDYHITEPGQVLVCLPNKVVVEIKSKKKVEIDGLSN